MSSTHHKFGAVVDNANANTVRIVLQLRTLLPSKLQPELQRMLDCSQASICSRSVRAAAPIPPSVFLRTAMPLLIEKKSLSDSMLDGVLFGELSVYTRSLDLPRPIRNLFRQIGAVLAH